MIKFNGTDMRTYKDFLTSEYAAFMQDSNTFLGLSYDEEAEITEEVRQMVYDYIEDVFGNRILGVQVYSNFANKYRAKLQECNSAFYDLYKMGKLVRIKDLTRADSSEFVQNYNRSKSIYTNNNTFTQDDINESTTSEIAENKTSLGSTTTTTPNLETSTDTPEITTTDTVTGQKAGRQVSFSSDLSENNYSGSVIPGTGVLVDDEGVPIMSTESGSSMQGVWSTDPTATSTSKTSANIIKSKESGTTATATTGGDTVNVTSNATNNATSFVNGTNDATGTNGQAGVSGTMSESFRDYDAYNYIKGIEAILNYNPFGFLKSKLEPLFFSFYGYDEEEEDLWPL